MALRSSKKMKIFEKNYWKIATIITIIATVCSISCFLLKEDSYLLPATICLGIAVFALIYAALLYVIEEDEKDKEKKDSNSNQEQEDNYFFNSNNYPWF